jgi:hypothetical protein
MTGVAPGARLMPIRACSTTGCPADAVAEGVRYAASMGADVINLSLGAPGEDPLMEEAIAFAAAHDVLVVAAAGNSGADVDTGVVWTPVGVDLDNLVGVAWTTAADTLAEQSNYGMVSVDVAAPGSDIVAPQRLGQGGGYTQWDGTSFSAPHVAGTAALMRSFQPDITAPEMVSVLAQSGTLIPELSGLVASSRRLDAARAVFGALFRDIPGSVFAGDVVWAWDRNITKGCNPPTNDLFCVDDEVTRGQMAAFLVRALALGAAPEGADSFSDDDGSVFENDIERLAAAGVTDGCGVGLYCPDAPVTREQMAAFLTRGYGLAAVSPELDTFSDDDGSIFEDEIERLAAAGVTKGCDDALFCPLDVVTRGQMAAFLRRAG